MGGIHSTYCGMWLTVGSFSVVWPEQILIEPLNGRGTARILWTWCYDFDRSPNKTKILTIIKIKYYFRTENNYKRLQLLIITLERLLHSSHR